MGCSQFLWGLMGEFWCSALKTPVAQPCSVSPLPVPSAIQPGKVSVTIAFPPTPCSPSYSVSKTFEWQQGEKAAQGSDNPSVLPAGDPCPFAFWVDRLPSFHGPGATGANRAAALGRTRGMEPSCAKCSPQGLCASPAPQSPPTGSTTALHQSMFTESWGTPNRAQQQSNTWAAPSKHRSGFSNGITDRWKVYEIKTKVYAIHKHNTDPVPTSITRKKAFF